MAKQEAQARARVQDSGKAKEMPDAIEFPRVCGETADMPISESVLSMGQEPARRSEIEMQRGAASRDAVVAAVDMQELLGDEKRNFSAAECCRYSIRSCRYCCWTPLSAWSDWTRAFASRRGVRWRRDLATFRARQ